MSSAHRKYRLDFKMRHRLLFGDDRWQSSSKIAYLSKYRPMTVQLAATIIRGCYDDGSENPRIPQLRGITITDVTEEGEAVLAASEEQP